MNKVYLGDSVYVEIENGMAKLTTNNGQEDSNTIFMEEEIAEAFIEWYEKNMRV